MSKISERIRAYVNDPSVADSYGEWGALNPIQRGLIRKLCDTCDMYEKLADSYVRGVVRCKDCVYWDGRGYDGRCEAPNNGLIRDYSNYDDFCSYGERKDDE